MRCYLLVSIMVLAASAGFSQDVDRIVVEEDAIKVDVRGTSVLILVPVSGRLANGLGYVVERLAYWDTPQPVFREVKDEIVVEKPTSNDLLCAFEMRNLKPNTKYAMPTFIKGASGEEIGPRARIRFKTGQPYFVPQIALDNTTAGRDSFTAKWRASDDVNVEVICFDKQTQKEVCHSSVLESKEYGFHCGAGLCKKEDGIAINKLEPGREYRLEINAYPNGYMKLYGDKYATLSYPFTTQDEVIKFDATKAIKLDLILGSKPSQITWWATRTPDEASIRLRYAVNGTLVDAPNIPFPAEITKTERKMTATISLSGWAQAVATLSSQKDGQTVYVLEMKERGEVVSSTAMAINLALPDEEEVEKEIKEAKKGGNKPAEKTLKALQEVVVAFAEYKKEQDKPGTPENNKWSKWSSGLLSILKIVGPLAAAL